MTREPPRNYLLQELTYLLLTQSIFLTIAWERIDFHFDLKDVVIIVSLKRQ